MGGEIYQNIEFTPPPLVQLDFGEYLLLGQNIVWLYGVIGLGHFTLKFLFSKMKLEILLV